MARLAEIKEALVAMVSSACSRAGLSQVVVGSEWPETERLQNVGRDNVQEIAIIHKFAHFVSGNMRFVHSVTNYPSGIKSMVSDFSLPSLGATSIILSYADQSNAPNVGDLVSCVLSNGDFNDSATYVAVAGDTLAMVASGLAAAINAQFVGIIATASGPVVTVTNGAIDGYNVATNTGSTTTVKTATKWAVRSMQVNAWTGDLKTKSQIQQVIEDLFNSVDDMQGFFLPSGEHVEFHMMDARPDDGDVDKDVYTDLYLFQIKNMVDVSDQQFAIVAPNPQLLQKF